jgi:phenylpropionate dioxygenase-like ring-hydroxylating dioxygenase large terminal subunit
MEESEHSVNLKESPLQNFWYPVCQSHQLINKPLARRLFHIPVVLLRNQEGQPITFFDLCPHRNAPLSAGKITENGLLECPYHGWRFNGKGTCVDIPGYPNFHEENISKLVSYPTIEHQDLVWVYAKPVNEFPDKKPYNLPDYNTAGVFNGCNEMVVDANFKETLDNFVDSMHPHFVHRGLMYDDKNRQALTVKVHRLFRLLRGEKVIGLEAIFIDEHVNMGSKVFNMLAPKEAVTHYERYFVPIIHQAEYSYKDKIKFIVTFILTPETETRTRIFSKYTIKTQVPKWIARPLVKRVLLKILKQDKRILTLQSNAIINANKKSFIYSQVDLLPLHTRRFLNYLENEIPLETLAYEDKQYNVLL